MDLFSSRQLRVIARKSREIFSVARADIGRKGHPEGFPAGLWLTVRPAQPPFQAWCSVVVGRSGTEL
jgi:hypothetical protein